MPDRRPDVEVEFNDEIERLGKQNERLKQDLKATRQLLVEVLAATDGLRNTLNRIRELANERPDWPHRTITAARLRRALDTTDRR